MIKQPILRDFAQGSQEWHEFRRTSLGATSASVLMGCNPWKTKLDLYDEMVNGKTTPLNAAMKRGMDMEEEARQWFEKDQEIKVYPRTYSHPLIPYMHASFDGITDDMSKFCEIKCPGEKTHSLALKGEIPEFYMYQMQWQMSICNANFGWYVSYVGNEGWNVIVRLERDDVIIDKLEHEARKFWNDHILPKIPPSIKPARIDVSHEDSARKLRLEMNFRNREELKNKIKHLEGLVECLDQLIIEDACGESIELGKWKCTKVVTKGTVQYKNIEILKNIDLDLYRSEPKESWRIS